MAAGAPSRAARARGPLRFWTRRLAQDLRFARYASFRPHRAALGIRRGPPVGARARTRGGTPWRGARDEQMVEGGAPGRLCGLQPEREGPDRGLGLLGAACA